MSGRKRRLTPQTGAGTRAERGGMRSPFDENGSYTGVPVGGGKPVQDADDL